MKRREAIQNIALISAGIVLLPSCDFETWPVYDNLPLTRPQQKLITWLTETILPKGDIPIVTPEPTPYFVATMVNDCYVAEDIEKYKLGLQDLEKHLKETNQSPMKLKPAEGAAWIAELVEAGNSSENLKYFLNTTRRLSIQHFTSSEYFLTNNLGFEFIPGRFNGCVAV